MKTLIGILLVVFGLPVFSCADESRWTLDVARSEMTFQLSSTLHDVTGKVGEYEGSMTVSDDKVHATGEGIFSVSSMSTGNATRDRNMMKMFDDEHYPKITYRFDKTALPEASAGQTELLGALTICDVTHDHPMSVSVKRTETSITLSGQTQISLKEFHLKAPNVLGMIRVADAVTVKFTITYQLGETEASDEKSL